MLVLGTCTLLLCALLLLFFTSTARCEPDPGSELEDVVNRAAEDNTLVQILLLITLLALAPAILICVTSFTRIIVILSFVRNALGTPQMPPNQVLIGTALFLSLFIMSPVVAKVNTEAVQPYMNGEISREEAFENGLQPIREFMFKQTDPKDLALFLSLSRQEKPESPEDVSTVVLVPSFIISELKKAFIIAFLIYIPFMIIDVVVSGTLMSMGMLMLPPMIISLPFKLLLFVMVDGWHLIVKSLVTGFK
jgi:flagellar biosynthetic protein FliP